MERRLEAVYARIRAAAGRVGRSPDAVGIVAVTKGVDAARLRAARALGLADFGENRIQEALPKIAALGAGPRWHMVGHLQRNKAKAAAGAFALIHSVDSLRLADALATWGQAGREIPILLQIDVAGEPQKHGFAPRDVAAAARRLAGMRGIRVDGVMTIAPQTDDPETVRPVFQELRRLGQAVRAEIPEARHLSMGMSDDFEVAIEEGATLIRVGRALFGERPAR
ncbi:MAG: YggS family pyridoxal phosphate-dependent enzyme [Armatimonadetes bacterium]|nr:YggS family pyridoxal phosphate-dependent enzyme [Armatimonadota bacterium]